MHTALTAADLLEQGRSEAEVVVAGADARMSAAIAAHRLGVAIEPEGDAVDFALRTGALLAKGSLATAPLMRAILRTRRGGDRLVHVTWTFIPALGRSFLLADAGVNLAPGLVTRKDIARRVRAIARALGISDGIAVLGHSDRAHPDVESSRRADAWVRELRAAGYRPVVGPLSLDLAVSDEARRAKGVDDLPDVGILLAPDIVVGNVLYKALMLGAETTVASAAVASRFAAAVPSRACSVEEKALSVALARVAKDVP